MNAPQVVGDIAPRRLRTWILAAFAAVVGGVSLWLFSTELDFVASKGVALGSLSLRAQSQVLAPGVLGIGLLSATALLLIRHRFGIPVYWLSVAVAFAFFASEVFGCLHLPQVPGGEPYEAFVDPDCCQYTLWRMMEISMLGSLLMLGEWGTQSLCNLEEECSP